MGQPPELGSGSLKRDITPRVPYGLKMGSEAPCVTLSRSLVLDGLRFSMSTGESLEVYLITRVSVMLGPTAWATRSPIN